MSVAKKRVEELASALGDDQLQEVVDFMGFLLRKQETALQKDMTAASESSLSFWDNDDDEVWNHV